MKSKTRYILAGIGLAIIGLSHGYMLIGGLPANMMMGHAIANLTAGVLLGVAVFKK